MPNPYLPLRVTLDNAIAVGVWEDPAPPLIFISHLLTWWCPFAQGIDTFWPRSSHPLTSLWTKTQWCAPLCSNCCSSSGESRRRSPKKETIGEVLCIVADRPDGSGYFFETRSQGEKGKTALCFFVLGFVWTPDTQTMTSSPPYLLGNIWCVPGNP